MEKGPFSTALDNLSKVPDFMNEALAGESFTATLAKVPCFFIAVLEFAHKLAVSAANLDYRKFQAVIKWATVHC